MNLSKFLSLLLLAPLSIKAMENNPKKDSKKIIEESLVGSFPSSSRDYEEWRKQNIKKDYEAWRNETIDKTINDEWNNLYMVEKAVLLPAVGAVVVAAVTNDFIIAPIVKKTTGADISIVEKLQERSVNKFEDKYCDALVATIEKSESIKKFEALKELHKMHSIRNRERLNSITSSGSNSPAYVSVDAVGEFSYPVDPTQKQSNQSFSSFRESSEILSKIKKQDLINMITNKGAPERFCSQINYWPSKEETDCLRKTSGNKSDNYIIKKIFIYSKNDFISNVLYKDLNPTQFDKALDDINDMINDEEKTYSDIQSYFDEFVKLPESDKKFADIYSPEGSDSDEVN